MILNFSCLRSSVSFACLILGLAAVTPPVVHGQFLQGTIDGNITDTSQAALVGAKIVAIDQATGLVRETVTSAAGVDTLPNVPPGTYAVTISSPGFQPHTRSGVVVTAQTVTRVDAVLSVGEVKENVTVSAETVVLGARDAEPPD